MKDLAPDSREVFQTNKDKTLKQVVHIGCSDNFIDASQVYSSSNCIEARAGTLDHCDLTIDPFWPHCMFELRGKCSNDECTWQHVRDYNKRNIRQLNDSASSGIYPFSMLRILASISQSW